MRRKLETIPGKVLRTWDDDTLSSTAVACTAIINSLKARAVTDGSKDALELATANRRNIRRIMRERMKDCQLTLPGWEA